MHTTKKFAAVALLSLTACGGAVEAQPVGETTQVAVACGHAEALSDGGTEIRFADTDAWAFALTADPASPYGYDLTLEGDAEALTLPQAEAVGRCLREMFDAGLPSGTTTL